jgi:alpha-beta hydrolase superfamily lysophospholipase
MLPAFPTEAAARHEEGFLHSADHLRLYWQRFTPPAAKATVMVLHGGGDHCGRYPGITAALVAAGFQVALLDFRGHGQSDGRRWYVDAFQDYLLDLDAFVAKLSQDGIAGEQLFAIGHSQGGLIAALWAISHRGLLSGLVLSSPWFALAKPPPAAKVLVGRLVGKVVPWLPIAAPLDSTQLTSDPELQRWTDRDPLYGRKVTPRWFDEAQRAQRQALRRAPELDTPLLLLAGGADPVADVGAERAFYDAVPGAEKKLVIYEGFRHEIFNETKREQPIGAAVAWIEAHARGHTR